MASFLKNFAKDQNYNPDGSLTPEFREYMRQTGSSDIEINQMEEVSIRHATIDREQAEWQIELERQVALEQAQKLELQRQRLDGLVQVIRELVALEKAPDISLLANVDLSFPDICSCLSKGLLSVPEAVWLIQVILNVSAAPEEIEYFRTSLSKVVYHGAFSVEDAHAIDNSLKSLGITLPYVLANKSNPPVDFSKMSPSEKIAFESAGLDPEELLSQGFLEPDDFYDPLDEAESEAPLVYAAPAWEPPDIEF